MKKLTITGLLLIIGFQLPAQQLLRLEDAIVQALEQNYSIRLQQYHVEKSQNNVSRAMSGQRPVVEFSASYEGGYEDATNEIASIGDEPSAPISLDGTRTGFSAQNQMSVPLFTGFRNRYTYTQLENTAQMSQLELQGIVEQTISLVVLRYLEVSRLQMALSIDQEVITNSLDRLQRIVTQEEFGVGNSLSKLQAEVDLKTDSANYRMNLLNYENARRNLNQLLVQPADYSYRVEEDVQLIDDLQFEELRAEMLMNNTDVALTQLGINRATYQERITKASIYPNLSFFARMQYSNVQNEAGFLQSTETVGPTAGVQLNWTLFNGGKRKIERQNARIDVDHSKMQQLDVQQSLEISLSNTYSSYSNYKQQLRIEQFGLQSFEQNYQKTQDNFELGLADATQLRTAQINLYAAQNRVNNLENNVKREEIELLRLSGRLKNTYNKN